MDVCGKSSRDRSDGASNRRRNLVVLRAGRNSLHPGWLEQAQDRNWDLIVSYYDDAVHEHPDDVRTVRRPGGKWDGLHAILSEPSLLDGYDCVWLPDDDIATTCGDINAIFDAMRAYDLSLAQPSLTRESYYSHFIVLQCPVFALRYTNFVEIMVPCFRTETLKRLLPEFEHTRSGWGLDWIWHRFETGERTAIIDSVSVFHTRPVGQYLQAAMERDRILPQDEEAALMRKYGMRRRPYPQAYRAVSKKGREIRGKMLVGLLMSIGYRSVIAEFRNVTDAGAVIWRQLRHQFYRPLNLKPLARPSLRRHLPFVNASNG